MDYIASALDPCIYCVCDPLACCCVALWLLLRFDENIIQDIAIKSK